jgi:hypothetical protein
MKVIFLDIDGVITSVRTGWYNFDIHALHFLRWICNEANVKIVIDSTWRYQYDKAFWLTIFEDTLHNDFRTKNIHSGDRRGGEIKEWIDRHPEIEGYLIIDDDKDMLLEQLPFFRQTKSLDGILCDDMMFIRDYFKCDGYPKDEKHIYIHPNMFEETRIKTP